MTSGDGMLKEWVSGIFHFRRVEKGAVVVPIASEMVRTRRLDILIDPQLRDAGEELVSHVILLMPLKLGLGGQDEVDQGDPSRPINFDRITPSATKPAATAPTDNAEEACSNKAEEAYDKCLDDLKNTNLDCVAVSDKVLGVIRL
ncbi:uncharacterized protein BBA_09397 [Beauveria bassiana ARSEF 2860]|uniref:Uncharacterized protein n=1 Tax=Beauveria bassiana (strain ARSEF 2860) TaxID=655819 RepID=J4VSQ7_BEAB2|nr:uncharacterized protein BBA_09397 [Beauveria bassiana ARSEF 2860]EJP61625.1 hypothetical protein BBA_09397 [Beauveria bassiana ARSEF 2860]